MRTSILRRQDLQPRTNSRVFVLLSFWDQPNNDRQGCEALSDSSEICNSNNNNDNNDTFVTVRLRPNRAKVTHHGSEGSIRWIFRDCVAGFETCQCLQRRQSCRRSQENRTSKTAIVPSPHSIMAMGRHCDLQHTTTHTHIFLLISPSVLTSSTAYLTFGLVFIWTSQSCENFFVALASWIHPCIRRLVPPNASIHPSSVSPVPTTHESAETYHMIDTCDPTVACWSEDGETFVIKDPKKFERSIIPQFFKHSKFSSFVRQLNFYSFRKIKYADTIRIDPKLEAETANYWRFRHERFRRGHQEWLCEIKRMNGQKNKAAATGSVTSLGATTPSKTTVQELRLQSEVTSLKKKMEEMTKNIDQLTSMVNQVSLQQSDDVINIQHQQQSFSTAEELPHKKSRIDLSLPDSVTSSVPNALPAVASVSTTSTQPQTIVPIARATAAVSTTAVATATATADSVAAPLPALPLAMDIDQPLLSSPPSIPSPVHSTPFQRGLSTSVESELSDDGFVDQLFTAFKADDDIDFSADIEADAEDVLGLGISSSDSVIVQSVPAPLQPETATSSLSSMSSSSNRPRPELMERLGEALGMLPTDIQELIVDRLVQSITGPKEVQQSLVASQVLGASSAGASGAAVSNSNTQKALAPVTATPLAVQTAATRRILSRSGSKSMDDGTTNAMSQAQQQQAMPMSLAAATLAALLAQYGNSPAVAAAAVAAAANKSTMDVSAVVGKKSAPAAAAKAHKTMPVISVHA